VEVAEEDMFYRMVESLTLDSHKNERKGNQFFLLSLGTSLTLRKGEKG